MVSSKTEQNGYNMRGFRYKFNLYEFPVQPYFDMIAGIFHQIHEIYDKLYLMTNPANAIKASVIDFR
jgi:hypothetical protein